MRKCPICEQLVDGTHSVSECSLCATIARLTRERDAALDHAASFTGT